VVGEALASVRKRDSFPILAPPWSGQGDNTGYCRVFTVQEFPCHHQRVDVMVTYSTNLVLMSWLLCLLCDDTPIHPINNLDHEQERSNSVNLMREVTGQLQPAPNYLREYYGSDGYCISSVFAQAVLLRILFHAILHVHLWYKPCATQMVTIPDFQSPTFAPLDLNGNRKRIANVNAFLSDHNPSRLMDFYHIFESDSYLNKPLSPSSDGESEYDGGGAKNLSIYLGIGEVPMQSLWSKFLHYLGTTRATLSTLNFSYLSTIELPKCYNSVMKQDSLLIIDSGVSVCISPHWSDFITYTMSKMKIKDLLLSNTVAGEGLLRWKVEDVAGLVVNLELHGYHIPGVEVRLLSPQVLLSTFGGHTTQTTRKIEVCLANGIILNAYLCPRSCLPLLPFVPEINHHSFWADAFAYSTEDVVHTKSILGSANQNLSGSQRELLLWHQRLSHANLA
jgi:hypothetical protein